MKHSHRHTITINHSQSQSLIVTHTFRGMTITAISHCFQLLIHLSPLLQSIQLQRLNDDISSKAFASNSHRTTHLQYRHLTHVFLWEYWWLSKSDFIPSSAWKERKRLVLDKNRPYNEEDDDEEWKDFTIQMVDDEGDLWDFSLNPASWNRLTDKR